LDILVGDDKKNLPKEKSGVERGCFFGYHWFSLYDEHNFNPLLLPAFLMILLGMNFILS